MAKGVASCCGAEAWRPATETLRRGERRSFEKDEVMDMITFKASARETLEDGNLLSRAV